MRGEDRLLRFGDAAGHDARCARCGSLLYSLVRDGAYVHVTLGTLIDAPSIRPTAHIFVAFKAEWDVIRDDLSQFAGLPDWAAAMTAIAPWATLGGAAPNDARFGPIDERRINVRENVRTLRMIVAGRDTIDGIIVGARNAAAFRLFDPIGRVAELSVSPSIP